MILEINANRHQHWYQMEISPQQHHQSKPTQYSISIMNTSIRQWRLFRPYQIQAEVNKGAFEPKHVPLTCVPISATTQPPKNQIPLPSRLDPIFLICEHQQDLRITLCCDCHIFLSLIAGLQFSIIPCNNFCLFRISKVQGDVS